MPCEDPKRTSDLKLSVLRLLVAKTLNDLRTAYHLSDELHVAMLLHKLSVLLLENDSHNRVKSLVPLLV